MVRFGEPDDPAKPSGLVRFDKVDLEISQNLVKPATRR